MLIFSTKKVASVFETRPSSFLSMARRPLENILQLFSKFPRENVNSLGDDWLCEVQKLLEINFLVDVTVKVEISTSCNTISRIFLKYRTANFEKYQQAGLPHATEKGLKFGTYK